jgi:hypothetical protein
MLIELATQIHSLNQAGRFVDEIVSVCVGSPIVSDEGKLIVWNVLCTEGLLLLF